MRKLKFKTCSRIPKKGYRIINKNIISVFISATKIRWAKAELVARVGLFSLDFWRRLRSHKIPIWFAVEWVLC